EVLEPLIEQLAICARRRRHKLAPVELDTQLARFPPRVGQVVGFERPAPLPPVDPQVQRVLAAARARPIAQARRVLDPLRRSATHGSWSSYSGPGAPQRRP